MQDFNFNMHKTIITAIVIATATAAAFAMATAANSFVIHPAYAATDCSHNTIERNQPDSLFVIAAASFLWAIFNVDNSAL